MSMPKGFKCSEKTKKKMSDSLKKAHEKSNFGFQKGRIPSIATREKMSIAIKNNLPSTAFKKGYHPATEFKKGRIASIEERERLSIAWKGKNHPNWKGGRKRTKEGYIYILKPEHPFCSNLGYIYEHRLIVEKQIGRYLKPKEIVHHINKIVDDSRPENLITFVSQSAHIRFHHNPVNVKPEEIIFNGNLIKQEV